MIHWSMSIESIRSSSYSLCGYLSITKHYISYKLLKSHSWVHHIGGYGCKVKWTDHAIALPSISNWSHIVEVWIVNPLIWVMLIDKGSPKAMIQWPLKVSVQNYELHKSYLYFCESRHCCDCSGEKAAQCWLALSDTQIDSIQSSNFAQNWFNSILNSKSFKENSIQKIIQI